MKLDPKEFDLRIARANDADAFVEQRISLFTSQGELAAGADFDRLRRETKGTFLETVGRGSPIVWLAEDRTGRVVGSAALVLVQRFPSLQNTSRFEGYVAHMFVDESARRRGIGTALLNTMIDEARRRGLVRLRLHSTEAGRALYDSFGFRLRTNDMDIRIDDVV